MARARVVAMGQSAAGDDGVGFAVLDELRRQPLPPGVELHSASEASALIPLLVTDGLVVVVDALLASPIGSLLELTPQDLDARAPSSLSSHGLSVAKTIALARLIHAEDVSPSIRILAVCIARPERLAFGLSNEARSAVPRAVSRVLELVGDHLDHA